MNRQKAVPIRVRTKSRGIVGARRPIALCGIPDLRNAHPFDQPSTKPAKSGQLAADALKRRTRITIRPSLASVLEGGFEVEVVPGTIVGDLLGIVGALVVTVVLGGRDGDQIPFRDPNFDR